MAKDRKFYENVLNAVAANGSSTEIDCRFADNITIQIAAAASTTATIKVVGALGDTPPDFSTAASVANPWGYYDIQVSDGGGTITDGNTGVAYSSAGGVKIVEVNTSGIDWIGLEVSGYSAGAVSADITITTE